MNNENNEVNSIQNQEAPTVIPEPTTPEVTPIVEAPVTPEVTPVVEAPVTPEVTPVVEAPVTPEVTPVVEAPVTPEVAPVVEAPVTPEVTPVVEAPVTPEVSPVVAAPVTPEVTPVVETPVTPEVTPVVTGPSMPDVTPMAPQTPVPEVNPLMSNPMPSMPDATSMPNTTITPSAEPGSTAPTTEEPKKKNNLVLIIIIAVVLIGLCVGIILIVSGSKKEESKPNDNDKSGEKETKPAETSKVESDFLALANKYVEAVDKMWKADLMTCQDGQDQTKSLKPSELSATDAYGGNAFYYVFINTKDDTEMKLDVDSDKDVAGWIRVGKADNSYYVALSDGTNYIVDKGMEFGIKSTELKESDVVTKGNGNNYQYMNGQIFGSNSEGNGWGIGDYKISTDDDDTNDGIYMTNGLKTAGWTPFCSNVQE